VEAVFPVTVSLVSSEEQKQELIYQLFQHSFPACPSFAPEVHPDDLDTFSYHSLSLI
jgi:hypothetical protein